MPANVPTTQPHPGKPVRTMADAAKAGQIIKVRCNLCHRQVNYLASDLVKVLGASWPSFVSPFPCSCCGTAEFIDVRTALPMLGDYGALQVRRPVSSRVVVTWKNLALGEKTPDERNMRDDDVPFG